MNAPTESTVLSTAMARYDVSVDAIRLALEPLAALETYTDRRKGLRRCVEMRTLIEARRKELKAEHIAAGRAIDDVASQLEAVVVGYETPLRALVKAEDDAKAAAKAAKDAELKAAQEAEARVRLKAEADAIAAQRAELEKTRQALMGEAQAVADERAAMATELAELRGAKAAAEQARAAAAMVERALAEAEAARINKLEYEAQQARRLAELAPDAEKIASYIGAMRRMFPGPVCSNDAAREAVVMFTVAVGDELDALEGWNQ